MRAYDDAALRRLMEEETHVEVNGADVLVKKATVDDRPGLLDPWVLAHEEEQRKNASVVPNRLRMLLSILFRPEAFLVQLRERAEHLVLSADADVTVDLTEREVEVSSEQLTLWKNAVTLWKYQPKEPAAGPRPCFLHFHGGGWFAGKPRGRDNVLKYIADHADAVVFDLDYSLSPEHKFPHAPNEAYAALRHIYQHADQYGIDRKRIAVGGGSAGGNLTAAITLMEKERGEQMMALQLPINAVVLLGPTCPPGYAWRADDFVVDESMKPYVGRIVDPVSDRALRTMVNAYRGTESSENPILSPGLADDLTGLPPAIIITSELDSLRSQAEFYAGQLVKAGVPVRTVRYRGITHATPGLFGHVPAAEAIALEIVAAIAALPTWDTPSSGDAADPTPLPEGTR